MGFELAGGIAFLLALFGLYRLLVQQKDANIATLKDQLSQRDARIKELETQTPDALLDAFSKRVKLAMEEIERLNKDRSQHASEVSKREAELRELQDRLAALASLIQDSDLVCPTCSAPLTHRGSRTVYGWYAGREAEADLEYREYSCGHHYDEGGTHDVPCPHDLDGKADDDPSRQISPSRIA